MKLSLRKAHAIQTELSQILGNTPETQLDPIIQTDEFSGSAAAQVKAGMKTLTDHMHEYFGMISAIFEIRKLVGAANHSSGISNILTEISEIEKKMSAQKQLLECGPHGDLNILDDKIAATSNQNKSQSTTRIAYSPTTSVLSAEFVADVKKEYLDNKRLRLKKKDQLLELNVSTKIELSPDVVKFLAKRGYV